MATIYIGVGIDWNEIYGDLSCCNVFPYRIASLFPNNEKIF